MPCEIRLDPDAELELRAAAAWYKERSSEVAKRFLEAVRSLARVVADRPERFPVLVDPATSSPVRRALVEGFPYALVYLVVGRTVHVLAVAHFARSPGYWIHRVRPE